MSHSEPSAAIADEKHVRSDSEILDDAPASDDNSSVDVQDGVKNIEAISKAWTFGALIAAYCRYGKRHSKQHVRHVQSSSLPIVSCSWPL
jgi:ketopantoate reductase